MADPQNNANNDPKSGFIAWLVESRHLLAALTALIAALAALLKPQDHTVTKNSYEATSAGIAKVENEMKQNHDDIVALRGYIDGVLHQPIVVNQAPSNPGSQAPGIRPPPKRHVIVLTPSGDVTSAVAESPSALPPPPPVHAPPSPWKAPDFGAIESKK